MDEKPNYFVIIPPEVRYDSRLKDKAKLLYGEILALSNKKGYCYATNNYFAKLYGISTTTVSLLIKNLVDAGHIESVLIYKEGTKEILNRYLRIFKEGYLRNLKEGIKENLKENNTSINNININKRESKEREIAVPSFEEVQVYVKEKNLNVNPKAFYDYFSEGDWKDSKGNKVLNWKQKILTWNKFEKSETSKEELNDKKEKEKWDRFLRGEI